LGTLRKAEKMTGRNIALTAADDVKFSTDITTPRASVGPGIVLL